MRKEIFVQAIAKFLIGIFVVGLLIFIPAGTFLFVNGWVFMGVLFMPMLFVGIVMMIKNPELLKLRLKAKEKQKEQSIVVKLSALMFLVGFIVAGLGFRFDWYILPNYVMLVSIIVFLVAYSLYVEVLRENTYLRRTIEVSENQKVIDSGLYGVVRHPMYTATLFLFLSMPLILGSVYSFLIFLVYPIIIVKRIKNEESFLEKELNGYAEYKEKVKYRLIPYVW
ncbi:MAG: isoprenylcysteine carboxylmethyltransferase family protein [Paludibacteraceae bacterium]|nr:isoprenylcysteine carboxylmethyltransferase family protein [Paludibacteraceae bacterium]